MKLSLPKLLETSRLLGTQAGQQLQELIEYVSSTLSQIIQSLRNGLTFRDNFDCLIQTVSLTHNNPQVINRGSTAKTVTGVTAMQTISTTTAITALVWYLDSSNSLVVVPQFLGAPTSAVNVILRIEY
jgi:hypothetical protein